MKGVLDHRAISACLLLLSLLFLQCSLSWPFTFPTFSFLHILSFGCFITFPFLFVLLFFSFCSSLLSVTNYYWCLPFFSPLDRSCPLGFFFSWHFSSSFYCFKLLVQFSSRAVVGLRAAQWHWALLLAHRTVDVGSSHRPPSPHARGWHTRLQVPPRCTLCLLRPVLAEWAVVSRSTTPSARAVPATSPGLSPVSAPSLI